MLEIFYILRMGETAAGKKNQAGKERHLDHYPAPGWGGAVGERKEVPPPAVVGGERGQAVLGLVGSVKLWQEAYFFVECVVEKLISG